MAAFGKPQVKEMQDFRLALPADAKIVVCKNTLMKIAADKVEGWSDLKQASQVCCMLLLHISALAEIMSDIILGPIWAP